MAIIHRSTLLLATTLLLALLSTPTTSARPCKTLFITFSIHPQPNPNNFIFPDPQSLLSDQITSTNELFIIDRSDFISFPDFEFDRPTRVQEDHVIKTPSFVKMMMDREGIDYDSVMDTSKDVLSVVVALLFGVGCGALTAACMYFVWMLVSGEDYDEEDEEKEGFLSAYDQIPSPKKGEYVKIPQADVAQAKEVV